MKGTKILCIDPESEYKDMCRNLNGSWLNAGGGKNGRSNLLQIRPAPRDDDDETDKLYTDEGNGMSDMALHMKTLEIEFSLYLPSLTDMQKAILKQTIIELYNQFGIFWETDIRQLKATDFPILSDLHALLEKKAEANKENPVYRDLAMLLYDAAAGSDSFLWNGHTTLEANSRFICLDTHDLQNASDNVKRTQYLNLLSWCWEEMSRDRNERCLLVCDEAYLMIDPQVPQSLVFLRNVEKRARKYEAGLAIIYDCGVMQTPTSIFRDADHRLLCGSVLPYEIPVFHKALSECGSLEVRPVAICVPQEIQEYCMELFGENVQIAAASHDLFAKRVNGQIYRPLVEKYIAGEKRL